MRYSARAGFINLQEEDTLQTVSNLEYQDGEISVNHNVLRGASESTRKRNASEIIKRFKSAPKSIWEDLEGLPDNEQRIIMFYLVLKTHQLFFDFHMEVLLTKWRALDPTFTKRDVLQFLEKRIDKHPEISEWTEESKRRISRSVKLILKQVGILQNEELHKVEAPNSFWERFVKAGETWFLEAMFLNEKERTEIIEGVS